jgi:hypothetical protein
MVTPPSALARNASGSNLAFDFFATAESPCASVADYIIAQPAPRRQACLGTERGPKNRKGGDRFGSVDLIRLLARRTRLQYPPAGSVDWRFACTVGTRFAACAARLSASAQTGHYAQFKSWRGVAAWQRPRFIHHDGHPPNGLAPNGLAAFRSIVRAGLRAGSGPCLLGCNHADCFWGTGVFRATSRANLSALNRAVFSRVAKRVASYSAVAF